MIRVTASEKPWYYNGITIIRINFKIREFSNNSCSSHVHLYVHIKKKHK